MATINISITRAYVCTYVSEARAWVHVDACLPACPRAPAAIVARNEGLAFARWQLSRGEFAIKRDDIIYRRTSYSREKEVADIGLSRGKGDQPTWRGPPPCVNLLIKPVPGHLPLAGSGPYALAM